MKEAIEEFGATMIVCIIGALAFAGLALFLKVAPEIKDSGLFAQLAEAYAEYFH